MALLAGLDLDNAGPRTATLSPPKVRPASELSPHVALNVRDN
jgi:hypothetical protein